MLANRKTDISVQWAQHFLEPRVWKNEKRGFKSKILNKSNINKLLSNKKNINKPNLLSNKQI